MPGHDVTAVLKALQDDNTEKDAKKGDKGKKKATAKAAADFSSDDDDEEEEKPVDFPVLDISAETETIVKVVSSDSVVLYLTVFSVVVS